MYGGAIIGDGGRTKWGSINGTERREGGDGSNGVKHIRVLREREDLSACGKMSGLKCQADSPTSEPDPELYSGSPVVVARKRARVGRDGVTIDGIGARGGEGDIGIFACRAGGQDGVRCDCGGEEGHT